MSQNQGGITKRVNHTPAFLRAAEQDKTGALAYLLYASFGVSLSEILAILRQLIENEDENLAHMAITASTQIRNNVVFVGNDFGGIRQQYPILIIEGERPQQDIYNFSALHVLGHALCHCSTTAVARKILTKAGSAVNGQGVTDSVAGKINKELSDSWALEDRQEFNMFLVEITAAQRASIDQVFDGLRAKATAFRTLMQAQAAPQQAIVIGGGGGGIPMAQVAAPAAQAAAAAAAGNAPAVGAPPAGNRPGRQPPAAPGNAAGGAAQ